MEIRKADSKGRVTGFDREGYYTAARTTNGVLIFTPLRPDKDIDIPFPASESVLDYLKGLGISPNTIAVDGISRTGYDRLRGGGHRLRENWPEGFDFDVFLGKIYGRE